MKKTIFISILSGVEAKDILRTNILQVLLSDSEVEIVLFLKSAKRAELYKKEFGEERIKYEVVKNYIAARFNRFFEWIRFYLLRTQTLFLHKKINFLEERNIFKFIFSVLLSFVLGHKLIRSFFRLLDLKLTKDDNFSYFFEKYKPKMVFLANLFDGVEISLLKKAKEKGVKSIGFINSWDKITSRGFVRSIPDKLIVPNEIVLREAVKFMDFNHENIFVSGVPQYDNYIKGSVWSRDEFFKKSGFSDPSKKLIVFAPMGKVFGESNDWPTMDLIFDFLSSGKVSHKSELLVRFPPNDFTDEKELKKRPYLHYTLPGTRFATTRGMDWDMSFAELEYLRNTLFHSSLVVGYGSSLGIDAALFDKPVICVNFLMVESKSKKANPLLRYNTTHYQNALRTGGIRIVRSEDDLFEWMNKYLENSSLDKEGRKRLVKEQCYKTDGLAGERIASFILSNL